MRPEILEAKNGSETARFKGIFLHSSYNPEAEAERFVRELSAEFTPKHVFIIEAALSYCVPFLKKRFPTARISVIRLTPGFENKDALWDKAFYLPDLSLSKSDGAKSLSGRLFDFAGEEGLFESLFFEWPPAAKAFPDAAKSAWKEIKDALEKSKSVLATREYFGARWLKNKINFFLNGRRFCTIFRTIPRPRSGNGRKGCAQIGRPILVCASGPSLENALDAIKAVRNRIFLCALSSACSVLNFHKITPDLCISTDGGFWAKKHLKSVLKNSWPLALSTEGNAPPQVLERCPVIPLCYGDDVLSRKICAAAGIEYMDAKRNGTVSGTALEFFLSQCGEDIFFAGLDLAPSKNLSHAEPNELENESAAKDFRLFPKMQRHSAAALPSPSLELYAAWFKEYNLTAGRKVFRIRGKENFSNTLGKIKDIEPQEFARLVLRGGETGGRNAEQGRVLENVSDGCLFQERQSSQGSQCNQYNQRNQCNQDRQAMQKKIAQCLKEYSQTESFDNEYFPAAFILARRSISAEEKEKFSRMLKEKKEKLLDGIFRKLK